MRKAPMGLFNLKKSKNKDDDFEASDEWLMGLADDDGFGSSRGGPNSSIPTDLASLAPDDFDPLLADTDDASSGDSLDRDLLDSENVDLSSWHFPDLAGDQPSAGDEVALAAFAPPHHAEGASQPGEMPLFATNPAGPASLDPFDSDATDIDGVLDDGVLDDGVLDENLRDHEPVQSFEADTGFLAKQPTADGGGFGSDLFASALDADIEDAIIEETFATDAPGPAPDLTVGQEPAVATNPTEDHAASTDGSGPPRGHEADLLCDILGVEPGSTWSDLQSAHAAAMSEYDPRLESDEDRIALAWAIRREMNSTYAMLRLLAAA